jgi:REP element-mobilizing transposase RayT
VSRAVEHRAERYFQHRNGERVSNALREGVKGKSAIHLARVYGEKKRNFVGQHFWARGYFVSTVGRDKAVIRECIRNQEREDS